QVGENLAVDLDTGHPQPGHEAAVRGAVQAAGRVDALDPEAPEVALAGAPITERVVAAVQQLLVGGTERAALVAVVALGALKRRAALLLGVDRSLDPGHRALLSSVGGQ